MAEPQPETQQPGQYGAVATAPPPQGYAPAPAGYAPAPQGPGGYEPGADGNPPPPPQMPQFGWMAPPPVGPDVPPGLEYLTQLDQVLVQQVVELLEAFTGWETDNKYAIKNKMGQQCYYAMETSGCCAKMFCKQNRGFNMKIVDNTQREVIEVKRDFKCCATKCCWLACCNCTQHAITVESPPGVLIGTIHNKSSAWRQTFTVTMGSSLEDQEELFDIVGPLCMCRCCCICCDFDFHVVSNSTEEQIGILKKQFTGMAKETFTDADNFSVSFPQDMDVKAKALLMCSIFLIDFMYFEDNQAEKKV